MGMFNKLLDEGQAGDNIGTLLRGIEKDDVERGQVVTDPGSITPHKKFKCTVVALTKEGGRHSPFFTRIWPQFYFRTTDVTASFTLPEGKQMVMPGDHITDLAVELIYPIAMDKGLHFAIREGGKTVGAGQVTDIVE